MIIDARDETTTIPPVSPTTVAATPRQHDSPLDNVKPEPPRTHPVTYGALALATLALILSLFAMRDDGDGFRQVQVNGNDCVIGPRADTDALYCVNAPVNSNP